jgi:hypothetical protein
MKPRVEHVPRVAGAGGARVCTKGLAAGALLALALLLGQASSARAYHTDRIRTTAGTAFTLRKNEWELGPFHANYGITDWLGVSTYVLPWVVLFPNVQVKLRLFSNERWALSLRPGLYYADFTLPHKLYGVGPDDADLKLWVVPIEAYVSRIIRHRFTLTGSAVYNYVTGTGSYDPQDVRGTAAASNAQIALGFEWRVNRIVALIVQSRLILYQEVGGAGTVNVDLDEHTTGQVSTNAKPAAFNSERGFSVSAAALFSWQHFHLRVGVGYGNYNVPGLNLVVPDRLPFPVFDLFWRFGGPKLAPVSLQP